MPTRLVFYDENNNELECYLNSNNELFIQVGEINKEDVQYSGCITLKKNDVKELIKILTEIEKEMPS
ncbi:hypothetical protein QQ054_36050 [Oscillatoria amoena NRMC-F 0135]|nr:hypothetical protein [Oscillatoria amoena NRMC-F 0135]